MKSKNIIFSLLMMVQAVFASEQPKCPCGPIEHLLGKSIVRKYVQKYPNSGLVANDDNEGVPANIVAAVEQFGQTIYLVDKDGNQIVPRPFKDTDKMVLPMYLCPEFLAKQAVLNDFNTNNRKDSLILFKQFLSKYEFNKLYANGICGECAVQNKNGRK